MKNEIHILGAPQTKILRQNVGYVRGSAAGEKNTNIGNVEGAPQAKKMVISGAAACKFLSLCSGLDYVGRAAGKNIDNFGISVGEKYR